MALFGAHLFLIYSHPLGIVYSAAALIALVAWDKHRGKSRFRLYACAAASWLALCLWLPTLIRLSDFVKPHNWMSPPDVNTIVDFFNFSSVSFQFAILAAFVLLLFTKLRPKQPVRSITLYLALAFLLVPIAMAVKSHLGVAVFDPRYFIPSVLAAGVVVAAALDSIGLSPSTMTIRTSEMWGLLAGFLLVYPLALAIGSPTLESPYVRLDRVLAGNTPVVTEDLNRFLPLTFYRGPGSPEYYYPLDWQEASKSNTLDATVSYKIILRWKQNGYLADNVLSSDEIMCRFNRFIVLGNPEMSWFRDRIENNPDYYVRAGVQLPPMPYPGPLREWLVTRKSPASCAGQTEAPD
jgi:hypothetical protein